MAPALSPRTLPVARGDRAVVHAECGLLVLVCSYEGQWESNKMHGNGTLSGPDGTYTGDWKYGLRHGEGIMSSSSGDSYTVS